MESFLTPVFSFLLVLPGFTPFFLLTTFFKSFLSINSPQPIMIFYLHLTQDSVSLLKPFHSLRKTLTADHYLRINCFQRQPRGNSDAELKNGVQ